MDTAGFQNPATCKHPDGQRTTLHGFGQRAGDVRKFFCRACQTQIDLDEIEKERVRASLTAK